MHTFAHRIICVFQIKNANDAEHTHTEETKQFNLHAQTEPVTQKIKKNTKTRVKFVVF